MWCEKKENSLKLHQPPIPNIPPFSQVPQLAITTISTGTHQTTNQSTQATAPLPLPHIKLHMQIHICPKIYMKARRAEIKYWKIIIIQIYVLFSFRDRLVRLGRRKICAIRNVKKISTFYFPQYKFHSLPFIMNITQLWISRCYNLYKFYISHSWRQEQEGQEEDDEMRYRLKNGRKSLTLSFISI